MSPFLIHGIKQGPYIRYFVQEGSGEQKSRVYLISEKGRADTHFYVAPGQILDRKTQIIAEIPTRFGNTMVNEVREDGN